MGWRSWEQLPPEMRVAAVRPYYDYLRKKRAALAVKRMQDVLLALILLVILLLPMLLVALLVKSTSPGPIFYRQERVTRYGRSFRIFKFRTMEAGADRKGALVTVGRDTRITAVGYFLRRFRLDELPQLLNILSGEMSFVGTRPEAAKFVRAYTPEMRATLLLPAGLTSSASIRFKDESRLLAESLNPEKTYLETILPQKMAYNLQDIRHFSWGREWGLMWRTLAAVFVPKRKK